MATNNIAMYIKNFGKSVQYAATDVFNERFENSSAFVSNNKDLFKEVYAAAKDYKSTIDKASGVVVSSKIYKAADQAKLNILDSIKTGKFYDKEREDAMATAAMGELGNFDDMDIEEFDFEGDQVNRVKKTSSKTDDSDIISSAIRASAQVSTEALANVTVRTGEYIAESNRANSRIIQAQNDFLIRSVNSGFTNMVNSISTINSNLSAVSILADNSKKFFESTSSKLDAMLKIMAEMNDRQSKVMNPPTKDTKEKVGFDDITTNGMPDIKAYLKNVAKNAKTAVGPMGDMLFGNTFGDGSNMLLTFAANPLSFIPKLLINMVIPKNLEKAAKSLDNTVSGLFANMIAQFNKMSKDENPILQKIGEIFGIRNNVKSGLDPSKYNKGAVPFDGVVKKSIIEVIPGYLRRIEKLLGGKDEKLFDYGSGKWTSAIEVNKDLKNIKKSNISSAFSDIMPHLNEMMESIRAKDKKQYDDFNNGIDRILEGIYNNYGSFRFNDKRTDEKYAEYGASSPDQIKLVREIFKRLPRDKVVQMAGKVMSSRANQTKQMERLETDDYSPLMTLFNNGINPKDLEKLQGITSGKTGAKYSPVNVLTEAKDSKGNNVFNYLDNILSELMIIRSSSTSGNSASGGGSSRRGRRSDPIRGGGNNFLNGISLLDDKGMPIAQSFSPSRLSEEQQKALKEKKAAEERYLRQRNRDIARGKVTDTDIGSGIYISPEDASLARGTFESMKAASEREDAKDTEENGSMIDKWVRDNKKNNNNSDDDAKKFSLFDQLTQAKGISEKWVVIKNNMASLLDKPGQMLTSMIQSADKRLYELMFGKNMGTGIDGEPIKGFADFMVNELKKTFEKVNDWIDTGLDKLKKKLGIDSFGELFTRLLDKIGLNEERRTAIKDKVREWTAPYVESTKKTFKGAINFTSDALTETYRDARYGTGGHEIQDASKVIMNRLQRQALGKFTQQWKSKPENAGRSEEDMKKDFYNSPMFKATNRYSDTAKERAREKLDAKYKAQAEAKAKELADKIKEENTPQENATGARYIKKSGITAISEGEMIIPAEYNPLNPNAKRVNKKKERSNEKKIANSFLEKIAKNIRFNADGNETIPVRPDFADDVKQEAKQVGREIKDGALRIIYGDEKKDADAVKKAMSDVGAHIKEYAPDAFSHGLLGGLLGTGASLLTGIVGGPLLGAAAGAAIGIVKKSDAMQNWLFGEYGADGEREGGVFSKKLQTNFKKYFPSMKNFGVTGALAGMLTPLGPVGGLLVGSAVGFMKKNDNVANYLFGAMNEETGERDDNGLISKNLQDTIKKGLPRAAIGAAAGLFMGPFGLIGNAAIGSGIGMLTSTDKFQDVVFGKMNDKGEREGGLVGAMHDGIVVPIKDALTGFKDSFLEFMHEKVMDPLERFMEPVGQDIKNMFISIGDSVSGFLNNRFEKSLGVPLDQFVKERFLGPLGNFFGNVMKASMKPLKWTIGAPFAMLGAYGDSRRRSQIKDAKATNMTAEERIQFMHEKPGFINKILGRTGYKTEEFDKTLAGIDQDQLSEMEDLLTDGIGGKKLFSQKIGDERHGMTNDTIEFIRRNKLDKTMDYKRRNKMLEAAGKGDLAKIKKILNSTGKDGKKIDEDIQDELYGALEGRSKSIVKLQNSKENAGREKDVIFSQLNKLGLKGIDGDNQSWYLRNISSEIKARKKNGMIDPSEAGDPVLAAIQQKEIDEAKKNADNIISKLNELKAIFTYFTGVNEKGENINDIKILETDSDGGSTYVDGATGKQILNNNRQDKKVRKFNAKRKKKNVSEVAQDAANEANSNIGDNAESSHETKSIPVQKKRVVTRVIDTIFGSKTVEENTKGETAVADDAESREVELAQKNFRSILTGKAAKVPIFGKFLSKLFGSKEDKKEKEDGEEDEESGSGGFFSRMVKSKPFKVIAGIIGGITGVAVLGHVGKFWDTKAAPAIKNFFDNNKFGEKIVNAITDLKDKIVGTFMNALDWFSGGNINGTYKDAGFPYMFKEGIVPFYVNGIGYFLEHMLPGAVGLILKALPSILEGAVKGIGKIFNISLSTMLGRNKLTNIDSSYEIGTKNPAEVLQQSFTKGNGGTSRTEAADWNKRHFGAAVSSYNNYNGNEFVVKGNFNDTNTKAQKSGITSYYDPATGATSYGYLDDNGNNIPPTTAFLQGLISESELRDYLITKMGMSVEDADKEISRLKGQMGNSGNGENGSSSYNNGTLSNGNFALNGQERGMGLDLLEGLIRAPFSKLGGKTIQNAGKFISHIPFVGKYAGKGLQKYGKFATAMNTKAGTFKATAATKAAAGATDDAAKLAAVQTTRVGKTIITNSGDEMAEFITKSLADAGIRTNSAGKFVNQAGKFVSDDAIKNILGVGKKATSELIGGKATIGALEEIAKNTSDDVLKGVINKTLASNAGNPGMAAKILKGIEKALGKIFGKDSFIMKKIASSVAKATGKNLVRAAAASDKAAKTVIGKILASCKNAGSKLLTAGSKFLQAVLPFLNIAFIISDFVTGYDNAAGILGILPEDTNIGQRVICGLLRVVNGKVTLGIIPETFLVDLFVNVFGPLFDIDLEEFNTQRAKAEETVLAWNAANPDDQYETVQTFANKDTFTTKLGNGIKKVGNAIGGGITKAWNWITGKGNEATAKAEKLGSKAAGFVYSTGAKVSKTVAAEQQMRMNAVDASTLGSGNLTESYDPTTGSIYYIDNNTGLQYNMDGTVREVGLGRGDGSYDNELTMAYNNNATNNYNTVANAATGVTPTTATLDVSSILSKVTIDERSQKAAVNSISKLMNGTINIWNDNLRSLNEIITDEKFITTDAIFNEEYRSILKENLINNIRYGIGNAWDTAQAVALAQWDKIFGKSETDANNRNNTVNGLAGGAVATGAIIGSFIAPGLGTAVGAGIGTLVGGAGMLINKFTSENKEFDAISDKTKNAVNTISNTILNLYNDKLIVSSGWIEEMKSSEDLLTTEHKDALIKATGDNLIEAIGKAWGASALLASAQWDIFFGIDSTRRTKNTILGTSAGAVVGAKMGMGLGTIGGPIGMAIGAGLGAGIGFLITKFAQNEADYSKIEESTKTSVNTIKESMLNLYNEKLTATSGWIDEIRKSTDLLTTDHKTILTDLTRSNLASAIGTAWAVSERLASAEWNKALGIDKSFNFWQGFKNLTSSMVNGVATLGVLSAPGAILGAGVGIFGSIMNSIDNATQIDTGAESTINLLIGKMNNLYNSKLISTTAWIDEMLLSSDLMTTDHKDKMVTLTKSNLINAIGNAWAVSEELAIAEWNKGLGLDKGYNFWSSLKEVAGSTVEGAAVGAVYGTSTGGPGLGTLIGGGAGALTGIIGSVIAKIDADTSVDPEAEKSITTLMDNMNVLYNTGMTTSNTWLDAVKLDTNFMTEVDKSILINGAKYKLRTAIGSAWGVAAELAQAKWNKCLGLDISFNFWNGVKDHGGAALTGTATGAMIGASIGGPFAPMTAAVGAAIGAGTGLIGSLWKSITKDQDDVKNSPTATSINTLITSMETLWTTNLTSSLTMLNNTKKFELDDSQKSLLIDNTRDKIAEQIGIAWGVANDLTVKKFNQALGLDKSFNFWSAVKNVTGNMKVGAAVGVAMRDPINGAINTSTGLISTIWNSLDFATDPEVQTGVTSLINSMEDLWMLKLTDTTTLIEKSKTDNNFLDKYSKDNLIDISRNGLNETLSTIWGAATNINKTKWQRAVTYYTNRKVYGNDMASSYGYNPAYQYTIPDSEKAEYETQINGIDEVTKLIDDLWVNKLNSMLSIVNSGSIGDIDLVSESAGVDWKPIDDGLDSIGSYYDNIKINFKDNKTNFKTYGNNAPRSNESFSGVKNLMFYTKKLYGVVPLLFNKATYDSAEQYSKYYKTLSTGLTYVNTVGSSTTSELNKITINTRFDKLFKASTFSDPIKNIIHMTEKILSFPLYMSKYMVKKIEKLYNDNDAFNFLGQFDKFANALSGAFTKRTSPAGSGGFGSGPEDDLAPPNGVAFGDIVNQVDNNVATIPYGTTNGLQQNIGNSGCAPVNATNIINDIYGKGTISVQKAAEYALKNRYKDSNGGTTIDYFSGILNDYGIKNNISTDKRDIVSSINNNNPVVLLGKDGSFGNNPHYMTVMGVDNNGDAVVMDPNTRNDYDSYKMSSILNNTMGSVNIDSMNLPMAPPAQPKTSGFGRFKNRMSGYGRNVKKLFGFGPETYVNKIIHQNLGSFSPLTVNQLKDWMTKKGKTKFAEWAPHFIQASNESGLDPRYLVSHSALETGWGNSTINSKKNNFYGIGAFDSSPYTSAYSYNDKAAGIIEGAKWIARNYYRRAKGRQTTLYLMVHSPDGHNYATDSSWHTKIAKIMADCPYPNTKISYDQTSLENYNVNGSTGVTGTSTSNTSSGGNDTIGTMSEFFNKMNLNLVKDIYGEDNYNFLFGQDTSSDSSGNTIDNNGNVISGNAGSMANNFPFFLQTDPKWAKYPYTNPAKNSKAGTLGSHGCGATSLAMIAKSYGINHLPPNIADYAMKNGGVNKDGLGSNHSLFTSYAKDYNLRLTNPTGINGVVSSLRNKIPVIVGHGPGEFTKGGHLLVASGLDKDGNIMVNDPASTVRTNKRYTPSFFAKSMKSRFAISDANGNGSIDNVRTIGGMGSGPKITRNNLLSGYGPGTTKAPELINNTTKQAAVHTTTNTTNKTEATNDINYTRFLIKVIEILTSVSNNTEVLGAILKFLNDNLKTNISSSDVTKMNSMSKEKASKNLASNMLSNGGFQSLGNKGSSSGSESPTGNKNIDYILATMSSIAKE